LKLSCFDFDLPADRIAMRPASPRTSARLLVAERGTICDMRVRDLPRLLKPGDRLVLNDTKVIPARLIGHRVRDGANGSTTEARIEVTLLQPVDDGAWRALIKPSRKLRAGETVHFSEELRAERLPGADGTGLLRFNLRGKELDRALARTGIMPLPPYIASRRAADERDKRDYQTVFARRSGAVAAPTASLHFDQELLDCMTAQGIEFTNVTLHVGAGTFLPVKTDDPRQHEMHTEWGEISPEAAAGINATKRAGGRIIPVGTTALRLIESASDTSGIVHPWHGWTDIFILPGYDFRISDGLMTNFHLPKSTLMMLVSAFMGIGEIRKIYSHALANEYRFFSYGDASLLIPGARMARNTSRKRKGKNSP